MTPEILAQKVAELKQDVPCPICDGTARLTASNETLNYRRNYYAVIQYFYKCDKCGEGFNERATTDLTLQQVWDMYNELFPEEAKLDPTPDRRYKAQ